MYQKCFPKYNIYAVLSGMVCEIIAKFTSKYILWTLMSTMYDFRSRYQPRSQTLE